MAAITPIEEGQTVALWRETLNRLIETSLTTENYQQISDWLSENGQTGPAGMRGEPGVQGLRGYQGVPGDTRDCTAIPLAGVVPTAAALPTGQSAGVCYGVGSALTDIIVHISMGADVWKELGPVALPYGAGTQHTIYVAPDGDDARDGRGSHRAVATLATASTLATTLAADSGGDSVLVLIYPGEYVVASELMWPDNCVIKSFGGSAVTKIIPAESSETTNVFLVGNNTVVDGFTFEGWRLDTLGKEYTPATIGNTIGDEEGNPQHGFAIAFRPEAVITQPPLIKNIVTYRSVDQELVSQPLNVADGNQILGNGMGCVIADGSVLNSYSVFPHMIVTGISANSPNGITLYAKKGALITATDVKSAWAHKHLLATKGGEILANGCLTQAGDYSIWAEGTGTSLVPYAIENSKNVLDNSMGAHIMNTKTVITDAMWNSITGFSCGVTAPTPELEAFIREVSGVFVDAMAYSLQNGNDRPMRQFGKTLFNWKGLPTFGINCTNMFLELFTSGTEYIKSFNFTQTSKDMVSAMSNNLLYLVENYDTDDGLNKIEYSKIVASAHHFAFPMAGVLRVAMPTKFGGLGNYSGIKSSIKEKESGKVKFSGQDHNGNMILPGGLNIDGESGELRGPSFEAVLKRTAIRNSIARSF